MQKWLRRPLGVGAGCMAEKALALELLAPPPCPLPAAFWIAPVVRGCMHRPACRYHSRPHSYMAARAAYLLRFPPPCRCLVLFSNAAVFQARPLPGFDFHPFGSLVQGPPAGSRPARVFKCVFGGHSGHPNLQGRGLHTSDAFARVHFTYDVYPSVVDWNLTCERKGGNFLVNHENNST